MIGKKIRGFKFDSAERCGYPYQMDYHIGEIGTIIDSNKFNYVVKFESNDWEYPKDLCLQHLVEEDNSKLLVTSSFYRESLGFEVPTHYKTEKEFDVIDFCKMYNLNFNLGNVVKYCARAGKKDDIIKDLKKALDYLQREIKHLENI